MEEHEIKKEKLIDNRKKICTSAKTEADNSTKDMLHDISFIGILGAGLTTLFNTAGGSELATTVMGVSFTTLASVAFAKNSYTKRFLKVVANHADIDAVSIENGEDITHKRVQGYESYKFDVRKNYKGGIGSIFNIRSLAIAGAVASSLAFLSDATNQTDARKDEDIDVENSNQGVSLCIGSGDDKDCVDITFTPSSLTP